VSSLSCLLHPSLVLTIIITITITVTITITITITIAITITFITRDGPWRWQAVSQSERLVDEHNPVFASELTLQAMQPGASSTSP
jgi:hypothetical protein